MELGDGELFNLLSEKYASEVISLMILERLWSRIKGYLDNKAEKKEAEDMEKRLTKMEKEIAVNTAIDKRRDNERKSN